MTLTPKALESSQSQSRTLLLQGHMEYPRPLCNRSSVVCNFQDHRIGAPHARKVLLFACTGDARFPMDYLPEANHQVFQLVFHWQSFDEKDQIDNEFRIQLPAGPSSP